MAFECLDACPAFPDCGCEVAVSWKPCPVRFMDCRQPSETVYAGVRCTTCGHAITAQEWDQIKHGDDQVNHADGDGRVRGALSTNGAEGLGRLTASQPVMEPDLPDAASRPGVQSDAGGRDDAYHERNQLVALLAHLYPSGTRQTDIEGWDPEWHGCVYVELPTGQCAWHYHDDEAHLFASLPKYTKDWDGHTTDEKYHRVAKFRGFLRGIASSFDELLRQADL